MFDLWFVLKIKYIAAWELLTRYNKHT